MLYFLLSILIVVSIIVMMSPCAPLKRDRYNDEDNVQVLVRCTCTLSKLRSGGEEDYKGEWAGIVSRFN